MYDWHFFDDEVCKGRFFVHFCRGKYRFVAEIKICVAENIDLSRVQKPKQLLSMNPSKFKAFSDSECSSSLHFSSMCALEQICNDFQDLTFWFCWKIKSHFGVLAVSLLIDAL
jgi:hypothetical protein